jgi:hypothetical protein
MRNLLACLVLSCSAASTYAAEPQRWCTESYGFPMAELVILDDGPVIKISGKVIARPHKEQVIFGTMDFVSHGTMQRDQKVAYYQDHLFWPCS